MHHIWRPIHKVSLQSYDAFKQIFTTQPSNVDRAEICGGDARTSRLVARRRFKHGPNFDSVVGIDLAAPITRARVHRYVKEAQVFVVGTAPLCQPYGP